jgi:hypothetical protein
MGVVPPSLSKREELDIPTFSPSSFLIYFLPKNAYLSYMKQKLPMIRRDNDERAIQ